MQPLHASLCGLAAATFLAFGCASTPPESACFEPAECAPDTPLCSPRGVCSRGCNSDADCKDLEQQTQCDSAERLCTVPCTGDVMGQYACVDGRRSYCRQDESLSCTLCPGKCGAGTYCDGEACQPQRGAGEPCAANAECEGRTCTDAGQCSVEQGEPCTPESCDGVCATRGGGDTMCIRWRCPSDCADRTDGGLEWYCRGYDTYEACVPLERCIWQGGCSTFAESTCGQSCQPGGGCWTYCVPNEISTDDD